MFADTTVMDRCPDYRGLIEREMTSELWREVQFL
jgi:hypothetical protein